MLSILTYSRGNVLSELGSERPKPGRGLCVIATVLNPRLSYIATRLTTLSRHSITSRRYQPKREGTLLWHCSAERSIWTALERKRATKDFCSLLKGYVCEMVYLVEGIWDKSRLGKCVWAGTSRGAVAGAKRSCNLSTVGSRFAVFQVAATSCTTFVRSTSSGCCCYTLHSADTPGITTAT